MEIVPKNCISYRTNITGTTIATKQENNLLTLTYEPSNMFEGRGIGPHTLKNIPHDDLENRSNMLKAYVIGQFNSNKV